MNRPVCIVTGANTGIGEVTAKELANRGYSVLLACRNEEKTEPVRKAIVSAHGENTARFVHLDLGDLSSIRKAAKDILALGLPIPLLVNNAGLVKRGQTKENFEICFGVNHLGPYLLTRLLLPNLLAQEKSRVVCVASRAHYRAKRIDFADAKKPTKTIIGMREYSVSKLANVLFASELARRYGGQGLTACSLHPGVIASEIWRRVPNPFRYLMTRTMISVEEGAQTSLHCATAELGENGLYYDKCKPVKPSKLARDPELAKLLWDKSAEFVGL